MKKFFSKGFSIGFLVTLILSLTLYFASILSALIDGRISKLTLTEAIISPIVGGAIFAFFGGIIGRWLYNLWVLDKHSRVIGFLAGAGSFFILAFFSETLVIKGLYKIVLFPGVIVSLILFSEVGELWLANAVSWIFWGLLGWGLGFFWEEVRKEFFHENRE